MFFGVLECFIWLFLPSFILRCLLLNQILLSFLPLCSILYFNVIFELKVLNQQLWVFPMVFVKELRHFHTFQDWFLKHSIILNNEWNTYCNVRDSRWGLRNNILRLCKGTVDKTGNQSDVIHLFDYLNIIILD